MRAANSPVEKTERTYAKLLLWGGVSLALFVFVCWGGIHFYRQYQENRLVRRAAAVLGGGDVKAASLMVRRALQVNPENPAAARLIAQICEKTGDRAALDWRRKVLELAPNSPDDTLALVRCALRFNELALADKTLQSVQASMQEKPEFHAASGRLAEMRNNAESAEKEWARAAELAPDNAGYRFQLALLRLGSTDSAKRAAALAVLQELRQDPGQRGAATRTLLIDGIAHHSDPQALRSLAFELQGFPGAPFNDRIMYLEILRQLQDPGFQDYLAELKRAVTAQPADLAEFLAWMTRGGMSSEAIAFAESLPPEALSRWPVPFAVADARAALKDWVQLEQSLRAQDWGAYDFLRHACIARALRGQEKTLEADQELHAAQKDASIYAQSLSALTQTIAGWGWQPETVELLWALAKLPETQADALQTLYDLYTKQADTSGIYRTLSKFAELRPDDLSLQNNLAQVSLLLGLDVDHARRVAADLAAKEPANAAFLSTYAFSLLSKGDVKEALQVMDGLSTQQLSDPAVAAYYGVILAAAGQKEKANEYLGRGAAANLLPEEKTLVAKAQASLH